MKRALVAALAAGVMLCAAPAQRRRSRFRNLVDTAHTSAQTKAFFEAYYTAKTNRDPAGTMAHFAKPGMTYIDAILGWPLYSWDQLNGLFTNIMPKWPASARSYPTRVLGDMHSAVIAFTDSPELFGGEIRIYSAVDFHDGKIIRQIDYLGRPQYRGRAHQQAAHAARKVPHRLQGHDRRARFRRHAGRGEASARRARQGRRGGRGRAFQQRCRLRRRDAAQQDRRPQGHRSLSRPCARQAAFGAGVPRSSTCSAATGAAASNGGPHRRSRPPSSAASPRSNRTTAGSRACR